MLHRRFFVLFAYERFFAVIINISVGFDICLFEKLKKLSYCMLKRTYSIYLFYVGIFSRCYGSRYPEYKGRSVTLIIGKYLLVISNNSFVNIDI